MILEIIKWDNNRAAENAHFICYFTMPVNTNVLLCLVSLGSSCHITDFITALPFTYFPAVGTFDETERSQRAIEVVSSMHQLSFRSKNSYLRNLIFALDHIQHILVLHEVPDMLREYCLKAKRMIFPTFLVTEFHLVSWSQLMITLRYCNRQLITYLALCQSIEDFQAILLPTSTTFAEFDSLLCSIFAASYLEV